MLRERLAVLRGRGGPRGGLFWLLRKAVRVDVYDVLARALQPTVATLPEGTTLLTIATRDQLARASSTIVAALDPHCGLGVVETVRRGGRLYALVRGADTVLAQLRIELGMTRVDTPADLELDVGPRNAFLSFLYTPPDQRGVGHASTLVREVCGRLAEEGLDQCVCHVQTTNVASVNAFRRAGWTHSGWLLATAGGRFLGSVRGAGAAGVRLRARPLRHGPRSG